MLELKSFKEISLHERERAFAWEYEDDCGVRKGELNYKDHG